MTKELDQDNLIKALSDDNESIIRACVNCKHYRKPFGAEAICTRDVKMQFHPVTGKRTLMGASYKCVADRKVGGYSSDRSEYPCGLKGKHFELKEKVNWFQSWIK